MDIKKTRILHKRYTAQQWSNKTLKQGEIGALLSDDKAEVLEVRMGMSNGPFGEGLPFSSGVQLGISAVDTEAVKQYKIREDFPSVGRSTVIYIDQSCNAIWRWNEKTNNYSLCSAQVQPGEGNGWWNEINGGGANLYDEHGMLNLGTSTPIKWSMPNRVDISK